MKETQLTLPELALFAGTRAAAGAGIGLLLADRLSESQRRAVGWTLLIVGALSSVPLALEVLGHLRSIPCEGMEQQGKAAQAEIDEQLAHPSVLTPA